MYPDESFRFPKRFLMLLAVCCFAALVCPAQDTKDTSNVSPMLSAKAPTEVVQVKANLVEAPIAGETTANLGALGSKKIADTPYSIQVVPGEVIEDQQLQDLHDIYRLMPSVQGDGTRPQTRGMQGSVIQNSLQDGLNIVSTTEYAAEQFSRMQVIYGLAGTLFGPGSPAGIFNAISKRPLDERSTRFIFSGVTGASYLALLDTTGPIGSQKKIAYRLNLMNDYGTSYTAISSNLRRMAVLSVDFHITPQTVLETNFSHYHYKVMGLPASFSLATGVSFPSAMNASSSAYALPYAGNVDDTFTASGHLKHNFSANWKFDSGLLWQVADRQARGATFALQNATGKYTATTSSSTASRFTVLSYLATLNGQFKTGAIQHDLSFGFRGFYWNNFNPVNGATLTLGTASLQAPVQFAAPAYPDFTNRYKSANATQQSFTLGDTLTLTKQWSVMGAVTMNHLGAINYSKTGTTTSSSDNNNPSYSANIVYKPLHPVTLYGTYADSLQVGDSAPSGTTNYGSILPPYRSRQYEVGAKLAAGRVMYTLAAFQLQRPFDYTKGTTYVMDGKQRNRGLEFTADGNVAPRLRVLGGVTWLAPLILDSATASNNNKQVVGLSRVTMNVLAQYQIPKCSKAVLNLNSRFLTKAPTDNADASWASSYALFDAGANYWAKSWSIPTIFRLEVKNIANRRYWDNIVPGALTGYTGSGSASASLGAPRMLRASIQMTF